MRTQQAHNISSYNNSLRMEDDVERYVSNTRIFIYVNHMSFLTIKMSTRYTAE